MVGPKQVSAAEITQPLKKVLESPRNRIVSNWLRTKKRRRRLYDRLEKISQHKLEMKLIDVEYTFDRNKIIFYFTADGRIDFRELVMIWPLVFKTRIELRQIGVRDEAKMIGGLGVCGRSLCCATFWGFWSRSL